VSEQKQQTSTFAIHRSIYLQIKPVCVFQVARFAFSIHDSAAMTSDKTKALSISIQTTQSIIGNTLAMTFRISLEFRYQLIHPK